MGDEGLVREAGWDFSRGWCKQGMKVGLVPYRGSGAKAQNMLRYGCEQHEVGRAWGETGGGVERVAHRPERQLGP